MPTPLDRKSELQFKISLESSYAQMMCAINSFDSIFIELTRERLAQCSLTGYHDFNQIFRLRPVTSTINDRLELTVVPCASVERQRKITLDIFLFIAVQQIITEHKRESN